MLAATWTDGVLGVDLHTVLVPTPTGPVPTPTPMPFAGRIFSPIGLAMQLLGGSTELVTPLAQAVGAGSGSEPGSGSESAGLVALAEAAETVAAASSWLLSPVSTTVDWISGEIRGSNAAGAGQVKINGLRAARAGSPVTAIAPHVGVFAIPPSNNAELWTGAAGVSLEGHLAVRCLDQAASCSDPARMPTSLVMAVPKGQPVHIGTIAVIDPATAISSLASAGLSALGAAAIRRTRRVRWIRRIRVHRRLLRIRTSRWARSVRPTIRALLAAGSVDPGTGRVLVDDRVAIDPSPTLPVRGYDSSLSWREGSLGFGWSHPFEQALWEEPGRVVLRDEDGREVEIDTLALPGHRVAIGGEVESREAGLRVVRRGRDQWEVHGEGGRIRTFASAGYGPARLTTIRGAGGAIETSLSYDASGRLDEVRDAAVRSTTFDHRADGRLRAVVELDGAGSTPRTTRFEYDANGDLIRVEDSEGVRTYAYSNHLLVRETEPSGRTVYYQYDGVDASARCVRTWDDRGETNHVLHFMPERRTTVVEDAQGRPTTYLLDEEDGVARIVDPLGGSVDQPGRRS
jgi:YD repeat-containing protein